MGFDSRNVRLDVMDDDGSMSSMEFILVNAAQADSISGIYIAIGAFSIAVALGLALRRRSNFDIPKWPSRGVGEDHMLK